ncbi:hypothetical protein KY284_015140 [Solanum tuberosum]|nr:hypothetical protein KY284_015140 [Solanum tuberosum]
MFIAKLGKRFSIKDLGQLAYFLGVRVIRTPKGLYLFQRKYIKDIVERASMSGAKPVSTPPVTTNNLALEDSVHLSDSKDYQFFVGCLQYLVLTPPDIAFATNRLAQFSHRPTTNHLVSLRRMIHYLAGTIDKGIYFSKESPLVLHAFSNPDWAGNRDNRTFTSAYIIFLCKNPIFWCLKKQRTVAHSSTEAEVAHISTKDQLADLLTKPLSRHDFERFLSKIGVSDRPPSLGSVSGIFHIHIMQILLFNVILFGVES